MQKPPCVPHQRRSLLSHPLFRATHRNAVIMPTEIHGSAIALRLLLTVIAGTALGMDRSRNGHPAGLAPLSWSPWPPPSP
jgi:hypothetical protein